MTAPVAPTQVRHPWRTTARTVVQGVIGLASSAPLIYQAVTTHDSTEATGAFAVAVGVSAAVTRLMQLPIVNDVLTKLGLGAEPKV